MGRVSIIPSEGAICICNLWGIDFYLDGKTCKSICGTSCVPAWCVREIADMKKATMDVHSRTLKFAFKPKQGKDGVTNAKVTCFYMQLRAGADPSAEPLPCVELTRGPIATAVTKSQFRLLSKSQPKRQPEAKRAKGAVNNTNKECDHLRKSAHRMLLCETF